MNRLVMLLAALTISALTFAQTKVTGNVTDELGESVIGASVTVKGVSGTGAVSDINGNFTIMVPEGKHEIVISSVGFVPQTVSVKGKTEVKVVLKEDNNLLSEVVVVGYGTMKKSDLSGAVGQIKAEDLMRGGTIDLARGMQGKMAGVQIQQSDGAPGSGVSITVRGANSFQTSSQPLFIVDGVPFETGSTPSNDTSSNQTTNALSFINPHDIESIEVLKDASATAIYGSRGANGVVLITTKRGKAGKPKVEFYTNFTTSKIVKRMDMLDPVTYAMYCNEQTENSIYYEGSRTARLPYPGTWTYRGLPNGRVDYGAGTYNPAPEDFRNPGWYRDEYGNYSQVGVADWQDLIYQDGFSQEYNASVSGGDDKGWYAFSGNFTTQDGIIKNTGYERFSVRVNIARHITDWLEIGTNTSYTQSTTDFAKTSSDNSGVIRSAIVFPPTYDPNMEATTADNLSWLAANPAVYVDNARDQVKGINWFSSSFIEVKLFPWLKFRQNLGLSHTDNHRGYYYDRHTSEGKAPVNGKGGKGSDIWNGLTAESLVTFDKTFSNIHHVNAVGGFTVESGSWDNQSVVATNFPDDMTMDYDMSRALDRATLQSSIGTQRLVSFLGRVNYTLNDKYLFTASVRTDGSSKFTTKNKWATFLSGAFAWRASEEKFIKDLDIFSNLKFRVSYGETGNQGIGSYRTVPQLGTVNYPFDYALESGQAMISDPVSSDLRWETTAQWNAGIDFGFFDNRLSMTIDYYHKKTRDLLQDVVIPGSTGYQQMTTNIGNVTNEGLEFTFNYDVLPKSQLRWNISANLSFNKSTISGLQGDQFARRLWSSADEVFIQRNGCPIGAIYGYVEDGFYDNEAEVRADSRYTNADDATVRAMIGEIKYRDLNGDGAITADGDRTIIGDTNPDFTYGITNSFEWKNFSLSFMLQGTQGNDIFNGNLIDVKMGNVGNIPVFAYNSRWTADTYETARWPKATAGYTREWLLSDRYVEDGSYLKLKSLTLGYDWRRPVTGIEAIKITFTATNLFTISDYSWLDPDVNAFGSDASRRGVDIYSYPSARTFALGLNFTF